MRKIQLYPVLALIIMLSGCQLIGDIFKAGVWVGVLMVAVVVGILIFIVAKLFGGGK